MVSMGHRLREGPVAKWLERRTAKAPSDMYLWAAGISILFSLLMHHRKRVDEANFIGQWVPTLLILGLYNKIVKLFGSD